MDFSKEYMLMCEKADEIQKRRVFETLAGDYIKHPDYRVPIIVGTDIQSHYINAYNGQKIRLKEGFVWLPRQDQLQEMVKIGTMRIMQFDEEYSLEYWKTQYFPENMESPNYEYCGKTLEFCWLHLVMQINYNKTWNGKEWVIV